MENVSVVIIEEVSNDKNYGNVGDLEELNETDNFGNYIPAKKT